MIRLPVTGHTTSARLRALPVKRQSRFNIVNNVDGHRTGLPVGVLALRRSSRSRKRYQILLVTS